LIDLLTFAVLALTIVLIALQPSRLNEGLTASIGAIAVLAIGSARPADVWRGVVDTAPVLVFLVAMMVVSTIAQEGGCFDWAAHQAIVLSRQRARLLFLNLYLLGAMVTVFLSLDVTAIMIAPIVCVVIHRARLPPLPFVLACAYVANTASLFLPVSNLTNMLVYSLLAVPFWTFVQLMTLPNLAAMLVNLLVFGLLFGRAIPDRFELTEPSTAFSTRPSRLRVAAIGLGGVILGLLAFGALGWPLYLPAVIGAGSLAAVALLRRDLTARRIAVGIAWPLPPFVIGMYVVIEAANRVGLSAIWGQILISENASTTLGGLLTIAFGTALGSNLVNNLPTALIAIAGLATLPTGHLVGPAFASLIGTNVGPNITSFGSLATMLVLNTARHYRIRISTASYLAVGLITTPLMLLAATGTLWLLIR
jgi:arsenical pump membrane protein